MSKLTLIGMHNYMLHESDDLFSNMIMPDGIDIELVKDSILLKGGEFEVLYSDPYFVKQVIGHVSKKYSRTFAKWHEALQIEYNPLENYDRIEEWSDNEETGTNANTAVTGADTSTTHSEGVTENKKSAYDSDAYSADTHVDSGADAETRVNTSNTTVHTDTGTSNSTHSGRVHGNIGVTTSMQLLEAQLSISEWNLYEHITDVFLQELCIPVY